VAKTKDKRVADRIGNLLSQNGKEDKAMNSTRKTLLWVGSVSVYILGGLTGGASVVLCGIHPAVLGYWAWRPYGIGLVMGIVVTASLGCLGDWLKGKSREVDG